MPSALLRLLGAATGKKNHGGCHESGDRSKEANAQAMAGL